MQDLERMRADNKLRLLNADGTYPAFAYVMRITTADGYLWTKVGMTTKTPQQRADAIRKAGVKGTKYANVDVLYYIPCKSKFDAERMEDVLRAVMTLIDPRKFMPNDRLRAYHDDFITYIITHPDVRRYAKEFGVEEWVKENII